MAYRAKKNKPAYITNLVSTAKKMSHKVIKYKGNWNEKEKVEDKVLGRESYGNEWPLGRRQVTKDTNTIDQKHWLKN